MLRRERKQLEYVCKQYHHPIVLGMATTFIVTLLVFCGGMGGLYFYFSLVKDEVIPIADVRLRVKQAIFVVLCFLPVIVYMFWQLGWRVTYHTVGALQRITIELQRRIKTGERTPIKIREKDRIHDLVVEINRLLELNEMPQKPDVPIKKQEQPADEKKTSDDQDEGSLFYGKKSEA